MEDYCIYVSSIPKLQIRQKRKVVSSERLHGMAFK